MHTQVLYGNFATIGQWASPKEPLILCQCPDGPVTHNSGKMSRLRGRDASDGHVLAALHSLSEARCRGKHSGLYCPEHTAAQYVALSTTFAVRLPRQSAPLQPIPHWAFCDD